VQGPGVRSSVRQPAGYYEQQDLTERQSITMQELRRIRDKEKSISHIFRAQGQGAQMCWGSGSNQPASCSHCDDLEADKRPGELVSDGGDSRASSLSSPPIPVQ
jgi:hypothetical protein